MLELRVNQVDIVERRISLDSGETKNDDARTVIMTDEVYKLLSACIIGKQGDDYVFTREDGKRVKDFRGAWVKACTAAGVPNLMLHDLRRTAARNLRKLKMDESTIMKIGGWRTPSVFRRYNIVSEDDLVEASRLLDAKRENQEFGHSTATVDPEELGKKVQ